MRDTKRDTNFENAYQLWLDNYSGKGNKKPSLVEAAIFGANYRQVNTTSTRLKLLVSKLIKFFTTRFGE